MVPEHYGDLIFAVAKAAAQRTFARLTHKNKGVSAIDNRLSANPADPANKLVLSEYLDIYQEAWNWSISVAMAGLPLQLQKLVARETRLAVSLYRLLNAPSDPPPGQMNLGIGVHAELPPMLADLFPLDQDLNPQEVKLIYRIQTETSWERAPLNMYWMQCEDHAFDWFVVAPHTAVATVFFSTVIRAQESLVNVLPPKLVGTLTRDVSTRCHDNSVGWASMEALWAVNGSIVAVTPPRVVNIHGVEYKEGSSLNKLFETTAQLDTAAQESLRAELQKNLIAIKPE